MGKCVLKLVERFSGHCCAIKAGFHLQRSRSWSRKPSRESAYDLPVVKITNRSHKQSHKHDRIGVRRIRMFPFLPTPLTTLLLMFLL